MLANDSIYYAQLGISPLELEMTPALKQALSVSVFGIDMGGSLMLLRGLLCSHQDAHEAYCCRGIGLK